MEEIYSYTIKLIRYALKGDKPELTEKVDFEKLYAFGRSHGVENMMYIALRDLKIDVPKAAMDRFKMSYEMQIMVEATQALELEAIGEAFEKENVDYIPLKGSVVKYLYPMPDYRKSGDIDILIRPRDEEKMNDIMFSLGYEIDHSCDNHKVHIAYQKMPFMEVEIHRMLTEDTDRAFGFCQKVWDYADLDEEGKHKYSLRNEYLYMHLMAHLCKHLSHAGAGIRLITDLYIMQAKCQLDDGLVKKYMKKANLTELNIMASELVGKWFSDGCVTSSDTNVLERIVLTSGSFGTAEMHDAIKNSDTNLGNISWVIKRIFPPKAVMRRKYPIIDKKPYLMPILWIPRLFDMLFVNRKNTMKKLDERFAEDNTVTELRGVIKAVKPVK